MKILENKTSAAITILTLALVLSCGFINNSWAYDISGDCGQGKVACGTSCVNAGETCYFYDDNGRVKEIVSYNEHGKWDESGEPAQINKTVLTYDANGNLTGGRQYSSGSVSYDNIELIVSSTDEGTFLSPNTSGGGYTLVLDNNGRVLRDGYQRYNPYGAYEDVKSYTYDDDGNRTSQTAISCAITYNGIYPTRPGISSSNSNCSASGSPQAYTYVTDDDDNIIAIKLGDQIVAKYGYSDGYYDNKCSTLGECLSCSSGKLLKDNKCISASQGCGENYQLNNGHCFRVRYTPAEIAELVGESNTILLYYK